MTSEQNHILSVGSEFPAAYQPGVVWLTGLPAAGKSTLAMALEDQLKARCVPCRVLDGDIVRRGYAEIWDIPGKTAVRMSAGSVKPPGFLWKRNLS
jgi:adenylylsulfate kinase-like enzyme